MEWFVRELGRSGGEVVGWEKENFFELEGWVKLFFKLGNIQEKTEGDFDFNLLLVY